MDSKTKILNASLELFSKEGFHGTSTAKIATEAKVSNGTLFHHFKTKEELINTLYLTKKEEFKKYLLCNIETITPDKITIKKIWFACVQWYIDNEDCVSFFTMFSNSPFIDHLNKEEATRNFDFLVDIIKGLINNETIINVHPDLIVNTFYASILASFIFLLEHPEDIKDTKEIAFNMWWRSAINI